MWRTSAKIPTAWKVVVALRRRYRLYPPSERAICNFFAGADRWSRIVGWLLIMAVLAIILIPAYWR